MGRLFKDFRFIPSGSREVTYPEANMVAYFHESGPDAKNPGVAYAIGYVGKSNKPVFNFRFKSPESRLTYVNAKAAEYASHAAARETRVAAAREARTSFKTSLKVGDVVHTSWGYDQTNVDFFEVTRVLPSGKTVEVTAIEASVEETGFMSGRATGKKGCFVKGKEPKLCKVRGSGMGGGGDTVINADGRGYDGYFGGGPTHVSWYA